MNAGAFSISLNAVSDVRPVVENATKQAK